MFIYNCLRQKLYQEQAKDGKPEKICRELLKVIQRVCVCANMAVWPAFACGVGQIATSLYGGQTSVQTRVTAAAVRGHT